MPKIPNRVDEDAELAQAMAAMEDFCDPDKWEPSNKNPRNVWRNWEGYRVTAIARGRRFGFAIHHIELDDTSYSESTYSTREEAIDELARALIL